MDQRPDPVLTAHSNAVSLQAIPRESRNRSPTNLQSMLLTMVALTAAILPFVLPAVPVENDIAKHLMIARVLTSYHDPVLAYEKYFELAIRPVSNGLSWAILAGLMQVVHPFVAAKIYLVGLTLTLWFFSRKLALALGLPGTAALLVLPLCQTTGVFQGMLPFATSFAIYPALLWVLISRERGPGRAIRVALVLFALQAFHVVGWAIGCLTVLLFAVWPVLGKPRQPGRRAGGVLWADLAGVAATAPLLALVASGQPHSGLAIHYLPLVLHFRSMLAYTVWPLSMAAGVPLLLGILVLFGVCLAQVARRRTDRRFTILWLALLLVMAVLPYSINAMSPAGPRVLPFAIIVAMGVIHLRPQGWKIAATAATAAMVITSVFNTRAALAVQPACREFLAGMDSVAYGSRILPVFADMSLGGTKYCGPFWGIEDAYTIFRGGSNPYCYAAPYWKVGAHVLKFWHYDESYTYRFEQPSPRQKYDGVSREYDYVLIFGDLPFVASQVSREMRLCETHGRLQVFGRPGMCLDTPAHLAVAARTRP